MKILIAEDDCISCNDLEKHLKEWGYDIVTASDGIDAWELAKSNTFRPTILDWNMPGLNGAELSQRIRCEYQKDV